MLMQHTKNRFRFHDLLGLYSRRLLAEDPEEADARSRLYSWYAEAATAAMTFMHPQLVRLAVHPAPETIFASEADAIAWLDDGSCLRCWRSCRHVAHSDARSLSWQIVDQLRGYFLVRRDVDGWLPAAQAGLAAPKPPGTMPLESRC